MEISSDGNSSGRNLENNRVHIYKITHIESGRVYIGQTRKKRAIDRWHDHASLAIRKGLKTYFCHAIRAYGKEAFSFEILEICEKSDADTRERFYIALYESNKKGHGFNMSEGGDGGQNSISEEVRKRIADTKRGVKLGPCSPEKKEVISKAKLAQGLKHSPETLEKIKAKRRAYTLTPEHKASIKEGLNRTKTFLLTNEQLQEVLVLINTESDAKIALKFGVSRKMIWRIRHGKYSR